MTRVSVKSLAGTLLLATALCVRLGSCARILGVFPITSLSHQVVHRAVMMELARRGHELVVITPDPINDPSFPNYTEIDVSFMYEDFRRKFDFAGFQSTDESLFAVIASQMEYGTFWSESLLNHEPVRKLISPENTEEHFDLVFVEWLSTASACGFSHRFSAPMIGIVSLPPYRFMNDFLGNPTNPSYIPDVFLPYSDKMSFFERLDTFIYEARIRHFFYNTVIPKHQVIANRHFGPSMPSLLDLHYNVSMVFINFEPSFHPPRPDVPAVVHISGLHLKPPKPLPEDLQKYMDSAPKGVVYMSLGSNVKSSLLHPDKVQIFLDVFRQLEGYYVLWKWESDDLPGKPANVRTSKWMPQQDILRHPKVKVFIMQGGLQSIEEAINSGVPLIGIPFFSDQAFNVKRITEKGIGLQLDINTLSKEKLLHALKTILDNQSYGENARRLSAIMKDQPMAALDRAVWWTEYVLRHKGAAHLRTAAVGMPWYEYLLLDVVAFLLLTALVAITVLWRTTRFLYAKLRSRGTHKLKRN